jgi:hypothetical protein
MIAFVSCVGSPETYARRALPGLHRVGEPGSVAGQVTSESSIFEAYNRALDHFGVLEDLEALVLVHEDVELFDRDFGDRIRRALADPQVAIVGAVGARDVDSLAWWHGEVAGRAFEPRGALDGGFDEPEVDAVDGLLMALSPWAVRNLRFDEARYTGFHGYDVDLCFQAREAGRRVVVTELTLFHHTKGGLGDGDAFQAANRAFRAKWGFFPIDLRVAAA